MRILIAGEDPLETRPVATALERAGFRVEGVAIADLHENMILGEDVRDEVGALVVPAGTRLSATTAARLVEHARGGCVRIFMPSTSGVATRPSAPPSAP